MSAREEVLEDVLQRIAKERGVETMALGWEILDYIIEDKHEIAIERAKERRAKAQNIVSGKVSLDDKQHKTFIISAVRRAGRQAITRIKRARRTRSRDKKRGFTSVSKPYGLRGKFNGMGLAQDKEGKFFVHTHRARSKSYGDPAKIPQKDIRFIRSTG